MPSRYDLEANAMAETQRDPATAAAVRRETLRGMIDREERVKPAHACALAVLACGAAIQSQPFWVLAAIALRLASLVFTRWSTRRMLLTIESKQPLGHSVTVLCIALAVSGASWAGLILSVPTNASTMAILAIDSVAAIGVALVIVTYGPLRRAMTVFAASFIMTTGLGGVLLLGSLSPMAFAILTMLVLGAVLFSMGMAEHNVIAAHLLVDNRKLSSQLALALERTEKLAWRDPLTDLWNRRAFFETYQQSPECGTSRVFLTIDIDHFKSINDAFGHAAGDKVIRAVAHQMTSLESTLPKQSKHRSVRMGGEEFVMVLEDHDIASAEIAAERLRSLIRAIPKTLQLDPRIRVSASIGVAEQQPHETLDDVLRRSDLAMYSAKDRGRNQVACAA